MVFARQRHIKGNAKKVEDGKPVHARKEEKGNNKSEQEPSNSNYLTVN